MDGHASLYSTGEANITRGAGRSGIIQMVSSNASLSYAQIAEARLTPDQPLFFQLYKQRDDKLAEQRVREVISLGYNAIFLTVDAVVPGNRERDIRAPFELEEQEREAEKVEGADLADTPEEPVQKKEEKKEGESEEKKDEKPAQDDTFQAFAVLGIALVAMGEDIGSEMALRQFNHLVSALVLAHFPPKRV